MVSVDVSALGATCNQHPFHRAWRKSLRSTLSGRSTDAKTSDIRQLSDFYVFQQDSAQAHGAREAIELLTMETQEFIPPTLCPPNSPDLNPFDYKLWSVMQEKVYKKRIKDIDELRACILTAWDEMDQRIIGAEIGQWRTCLRACIKAKGGHFEHTLSQ